MSRDKFVAKYIDIDDEEAINDLDTLIEEVRHDVIDLYMSSLSEYCLRSPHCCEECPFHNEGCYIIELGSKF